MLLPQEVDYRLLTWLRDCLARGRAGRIAVSRWVLEGEAWERRGLRVARHLPYVCLLLLLSACQTISCDRSSTCNFTELTQDRGRQTTDVAREADVLTRP